MNLDLGAVGGSVLAVSQFTLAGSVDRGRRPGFDGAMEPGRARALFECFVGRLAELGVPVATGRFGADMKVFLVNDGPVTFLLDTRRGG
jgi:D-tyrosyl-tRNA(Tyr) deacylase